VVTDPRRVLVVDDDRAIVDLMRDFLEAEGFQVEGAVNAIEARAVLERAPVDCVLLDVMLPGESGFEVVRQIRGSSEVPVLFLSARGDDADKLRGLGLGADDYIVKSATPAEVVARVKAVLRRSSGTAARQSALLDFGRLILDLRAREVHVDGTVVPFTPREYELLSLFAEHPRQVFTYDGLLDRFWGHIGDRHTVTVHVGRIREKIEEDASNPQLIRNVWGVGYRFEGQRR
jgi:DNA-binding response OmpR family regulator